MILGIGTDLAEVDRYRFDEAQLARFAEKVYTDEEMRYAMRKRNWPERLAGFFASAFRTSAAASRSSFSWNRTHICPPAAASRGFI
jgi:phosphopantetheinyl transferase (holo-ACP synthase)